MRALYVSDEASRGRVKSLAQSLTIDFGHVG